VANPADVDVDDVDVDDVDDVDVDEAAEAAPPAATGTKIGLAALRAGIAAAA